MNIDIEQLKSQITTLEENLGEWKALDGFLVTSYDIARLTADIGAMKMRLGVMELVETYQKLRAATVQAYGSPQSDDYDEPYFLGQGTTLTQIIADLNAILEASND